MAGLGNASLILSANDAKLKQSLAQNETHIKSWAARVGGSMTGIFSGGGLAGVGLAVSGPLGASLAALSTSIGGVIDRLSTFRRIAQGAAALGVTGEAFQGLSAILRKAGGDASQTGSYFSHMGKNVFDAANGLGRARVAFAQLGIDAASLVNLPIDQQFLQIAEAISKVPAGAAQASAAIRIFGDTALLPQLARGRAGLEDFLSHLRETGAILSGEQLRLANEAAKAWSEAKHTLSNLWTGISNEFTVALAPLVVQIAELFSDGLKFAMPFFKWVAEGFKYLGDLCRESMSVVKSTVGEAITWVKELMASFGGIGQYLPSLSQIVEFVFKGMGYSWAIVYDSITAGIGAIRLAIAGLVRGVSLLVEGFERLTGIGGQLRQRMTAWSEEQARAGINQVRAFGSSITAVDAFFDRVRRGQQRTREDQRSVTQAIQETVQALANASFGTIKAAVVGTQDFNLAIQQRDWERMAGGQQNNQGRQLELLQGVNDRLDRLIGRDPLEFERWE